MAVNQKLSILFWLNRTKVNSKGLAPIWARITIDGMRAECSTGKHIMPEHWRTGLGLPNKNSPDATEITKRIFEIKFSLKKHFKSLAKSRDFVTAYDVKKSFLGISTPEDQYMFLSVLHQFHAIQVERARSGTLTMSRTFKWKQLADSCRDYIRLKFRTADMALTSMRPYFAEDLYHYLRTVKNLSQNSGMKRMKDLKQFMDYAVLREYITSNPFRTFKCVLVPTNRVRLDTSEIQKLAAKNIANQSLDEVRDCFLFVIYTGYSYKELSELTPENVQVGVDGRKWIIKTRSKSHNSKENVPLLSVPLQVIEKYREHPECLAKNKLLPVLSNQNYNDALKQVARVCGIKKKLTSHVARHTFATTIMLENQVPIETVSRMLGHRDLKTTQIYAEMTDTRISKDTLDLDEKLDPVSYNH